MTSILEMMLGDLVAGAQLDAEAELLDMSDRTRRTWDAIIERYGKVDSEQSE